MSVHPQVWFVFWSLSLEPGNLCWHGLYSIALTMVAGFASSWPLLWTCTLAILYHAGFILIHSLCNSWVDFFFVNRHCTAVCGHNRFHLCIPCPPKFGIYFLKIVFKTRTKLPQDPVFLFTTYLSSLTAHQTSSDHLFYLSWSSPSSNVLYLLPPQSLDNAVPSTSPNLPS